MAESSIDNIKNCQNKHGIITNPVEHLSHYFDILLTVHLNIFILILTNLMH